MPAAKDMHAHNIEVLEDTLMQAFSVACGGGLCALYLRLSCILLNLSVSLPPSGKMTICHRWWC